MKKITYILVLFLLLSFDLEAVEYKFYRRKTSEEKSCAALGNLGLYGLNALIGVGFYWAWQNKGLSKRESMFKATSGAALAFLATLPLHILFRSLHNSRKRALEWNSYLDKPILTFDEHGFSLEKIAGDKNSSYLWKDVIKVQWKHYGFIRTAENLYKIKIEFPHEINWIVAIEPSILDLETQKVTQKHFDTFKERLFEAAKKHDGNSAIMVTV